jgi:hypothetical protein
MDSLMYLILTAPVRPSCGATAAARKVEAMADHCRSHRVDPGRVAVGRHRRWLAEIQITPRREARGQAAGRTGANIPVSGSAPEPTGFERHREPRERSKTFDGEGRGVGWRNRFVLWSVD